MLKQGFTEHQVNFSLPKSRYFIQSFELLEVVALQLLPELELISVLTGRVCHPTHTAGVGRDLPLDMARLWK